MAKDPAALFYIDHWLVATKEMRAECRGWYLNLVLHQFKSGSLPGEIEELANLADVRISEFDLFQQMWQQVLKQKFEVLPTGRLQDAEAAEIIRSRETFKNKRAAAGRISAFIKFIRKHLCKDENIIFFIKQHVDVNTIATSDQQVLKQVFDHLFQLYINKNKNRDREDEDIGGLGDFEGAGERTTLVDLGVGPPGWNQFPDTPDRALELPEIKAVCALELLCLNGVKAEMPHIDRLWEVFKNQHFNGRKFYLSPDDAFSHFINWSKIQKINGTSQKIGPGEPKLGTSAARVKKASEW